MKRPLPDYRLCVMHYTGESKETLKVSHRTYLIRHKGNVSYISATETPLALSNLLHDDAAETRFALEDAGGGNAAAKQLRSVLADLWRNNNLLCPTVVLI